MSTETWPSDALDINRPNGARVHDALLSGSHNFGADRDLAHRLAAAVPGIAVDIFAERAFLHRAVGFCINAGIRQFLDLGCGIPSVGNAYRVIQHTAPDARVVCVDVDLAAVVLTRNMVKGNDRAGAIQADLRHPSHLLHHPDLTAVLRLDQPVAVLLVSVLHLLGDAEDPWSIVASLRDRLAAGSLLVISHLTGENRPADMAMLERVTHGAGLPITVRTRGDIERLVDGFELVDPGLVWAPHWRPNPNDIDHPAPAPSNVLVAVGRKP